MMTSRINNEPLTLDQVAHFAPSAMAIAPHSSRSSRYAYIPTKDVILGMQNAGFFPFAATQSKCRDLSRADFTKHMIRFRQADQTLALDDVFPEVVLVNAHDGSSTYKLMGGLLRLKCFNGMVTSESLLADVTIKHSGNVVDQVIEGSLQIAAQSKMALAAVNTWSQLQLTAGEQKVFAESAHILRFGDSDGEVETPITPAQLLEPRRSGDVGSDLWKTFNRVQENTIKGGLTAIARDENGRRLRRIRTREVKGIDQDVKLNRSLWHLAERMAELKAAV